MIQANKAKHLFHSLFLMVSIDRSDQQTLSARRAVGWAEEAGRIRANLGLEWGPDKATAVRGEFCFVCRLGSLPVC
jgi:hypothetical protein